MSLSCRTGSPTPFGRELFTAVGRIYGGLPPGGPSMIPDECTIRVDSRPQPGVEADEVRALLDAAIERAGARDPDARYEMVLADRKNAHLIERDHPLVQALAEAFRSVTGAEPAYGGGSWLADTASTGHLVPTVIFGPGAGARLHAERVARRRGRPRRGTGERRRGSACCSHRMAASHLECLGSLRVLATTCAGVAAGERALIVTDTAADAEIAAAMAGVLGALGASVVTVEYRPAELPGDEPPAAGERRDARGGRDLRADVGLRRFVPGQTCGLRAGCAVPHRARPQLDHAAAGGAVRRRLPCPRRACEAPCGPLRPRRRVRADERCRHQSARQRRGPPWPAAVGHRRRAGRLRGAARRRGRRKSRGGLGGGHGRHRRLAALPGAGPARKPRRAALRVRAARGHARDRKPGGSPTRSSAPATTACGALPKCRSVSTRARDRAARRSSSKGSSAGPMSPSATTLPTAARTTLAPTSTASCSRQRWRSTGSGSTRVPDGPARLATTPRFALTTVPPTEYARRRI